MPQSSHYWDTLCWKNWAVHIYKNGIGNAYGTWNNYMPLYQYILYFYGILQDSAQDVERNINYLKIFTLIFDFIGGLYLVKFIREKLSNQSDLIFYSLLFFLNVFYLHNTLAWGQVDGILSAFVIMSVYYAYKEKILLSIIFYVIALNFKFQAIVFVPLIFLMLVPLARKYFSIKKIVISLVAIVLVQVLIILPFLIAGQAKNILYIIGDYTGVVSAISMKADNFWYLLVKGNLMKINDDILFLGLTYKLWGMIMFTITGFFALFPMIKNLFNFLFRKRENSVSLDTILLTAALIPLLFFYFNTQMHERYSHPAIIFIACYAIIYKKYLVYILVSIAYFLNVESALAYLHLKNYNTLIFNEIFISIIYLIIIIMLFAYLYKVKLNFNNKKLIKNQL